MRSSKRGWIWTVLFKACRSNVWIRRLGLIWQPLNRPSMYISDNGRSTAQSSNQIAQGSADHCYDHSTSDKCDQDSVSRSIESNSTHMFGHPNSKAAISRPLHLRKYRQHQLQPHCMHSPIDLMHHLKLVGVTCSQSHAYIVPTPIFRRMARITAHQTRMAWNRCKASR